MLPALQDPKDLLASLERPALKVQPAILGRLVLQDHRAVRDLLE